MVTYRPLDLSFLSRGGPNPRDDIRATAQRILAGANWGPSQVSVKEIAKAQKKAKDAQKHAISPIQGFFDLLSAPLYGLANAFDESIAGHQADANDSVIEDIGKTVGGVFTGAAKGFGAGLRGGTAMLDPILPGININDEWQADPTDKTRFSDVATRVNVGMSTKDAMKPENWEEVKSKLEKLNEKPWYNQSMSEWLIPDDLNATDARKDYFTRTALGGIAADITGDPLNLLFLGGKSAATAPRAIEEGLEAARNSSNAMEVGIKSNFRKDVGPKSTFAPVDDIENVIPSLTGKKPVIPEPQIAAIDDIANIPKGRPIVAKAADYAVDKGAAKTLAGIGARDLPKQGVAIPIRNQHGIAARIAQIAAQNEPNWHYIAADILRDNAKGRNLDWAETLSLIERASAMSKAGVKHNPKALFAALKGRIADDVAKAIEPIRAERIVNTTKEVLHPGSQIALKRGDAQLAKKVIRRYAGQVAGKTTPVGIRSPEALARSIASGNTAAYSGPKQVNMLNYIANNIKFRGPKKFDKAVRVLKAVEDYYISRGLVPHSSSNIRPRGGKPGSTPLRLSAVAEAIGPGVLAENRNYITAILRGEEKALASLSPRAQQAIEVLRANESLATALPAQRGIEAAKAMATEITSKVQSSARTIDELNKLPEIAKMTTIRLGGGEAAASVAAQRVAEIVGKNNPVDAAFRINRLKTESWLAKNPIEGAALNGTSAEFLAAVNRAIAKASELPDPATLGRIAGPGAKVKEWFGARFNAAYGNRDMRPIFLENQASAMSTAANRAKLINELGRRFDPKDADLWHEAMRTAQMNGIAEGKVLELQKEIMAIMEHLAGGSGLRAGAVADATVIGRGRLMMRELNSNLKRFGLHGIEFTAKKNVTDAAGNVHDFSKGIDWIKSWEAWDIKDPYTFLHKFQSAIEHTVREKNMFDEIISRFASPKRHGNVKYGLSHPRLRGFYFNEEGAKQATQFIKMLNEVSTPNSKALQYVDHVISKLKAALTIYVPGHHVTNLIGDTMYNWLAGVNNPARYEQGMKLAFYMKGMLKDLDELEMMAGPNAFKQAIARGTVGLEGLTQAGLKAPNPRGMQTMVTMRNGQKVTYEMLATAAQKHGINPTARVLEEVTSDVTSVLDKFRPTGGRAQRVVHEVSEFRDWIPRFAQFIDGIAKSNAKSFAQAAEKSAGSVRKWHPDGLDLTKFERDVMKRVFPFYSWTRKAIPLAIESSVFSGPKVMAYPRVMEAIALANGIQGEDSTTGGMFPGDQMFPDWLRNRGIGPIAGGPGSYTVINPSTPVLDMISLLGNPGHSAIDMMNPLIKAPIEVAQEDTLGRNAPITDWSDYAAKQIPVVSHLGRGTGQFGVSDSTKEEGFPNWTNIQNMLFGLKRADTGKYQKSAQFDVRDYFKRKAEGR